MKISVVSRNQKHLLEIARLLRERGAGDEVNVFCGSLERLGARPSSAAPDLLVVDRPEAGDLSRIEQLGVAWPRLTAIVLSESQTIDFMADAMRAGVREVLPAPASADSLLPAVARVDHKLTMHDQVNGKVLAFVSCKGGSGATFLATNLGYALSTLGNKRVALIDLNLQFGDASLFVADHKPLATLADVALQIHRLDGTLLASSMMAVTSNFSVLAAPDDPVHASDVKPEHIDKLLGIARGQYDFVILDIGRSLDPVSVRALDLADTIYPVLQTTLPYIRDGKRMLEVFRSLGYAPEKLQVVVNRYQKQAHIKLHDLEVACGTPVGRMVPNHYETAAASVNQGVPVLKLARKSPIARALAEFARSLDGDTAPRTGNWLARFIKGPKPAATPAETACFEEKQA